MPKNQEQRTRRCSPSARFHLPSEMSSCLLWRAFNLRHQSRQNDGNQDHAHPCDLQGFEALAEQCDGDECRDRRFDH